MNIRGHSKFISLLDFKFGFSQSDKCPMKFGDTQNAITIMMQIEVRLKWPECHSCKCQIRKAGITSRYLWVLFCPEIIPSFDPGMIILCWRSTTSLLISIINSICSTTNLASFYFAFFHSILKIVYVQLGTVRSDYSDAACSLFNQS